MYSKMFLRLGNKFYFVEYNNQQTSADEIIEVVRDFIEDGDIPEFDTLAEELEVDYDSSIEEFDDIPSYEL